MHCYRLGYRRVGMRLVGSLFDLYSWAKLEIASRVVRNVCARGRTDFVEHLELHMHATHGPDMRMTTV